MQYVLRWKLTNYFKNRCRFLDHRVVWSLLRRVAIEFNGYIVLLPGISE